MSSRGSSYPEIKPAFLMPQAGGFFTTSATWEAFTLPELGRLNSATVRKANRMCWPPFRLTLDAMEVQHFF